MLFVSSSAAVRDVVLLYGLSDGSGVAVGSTQGSAGGGVSLYNSSATFDNVTFRCEGHCCNVNRNFSDACRPCPAATSPVPLAVERSMPR